MSKVPAVAPAPWLPPEYEIADASAVQALVRGDANADQQKRALNWVIYHAADTYGFDYRQNDRDHAFGAGRRFVGLQIVKMLNLNTAALANAAANMPAKKNRAKP